MTDSRRHSDISSLKTDEEKSDYTHSIPEAHAPPPTKEAVVQAEAAAVANTIPNGGLLAWLQVLSGFMCFLNSWGLVNAFGVFQDYYSETLIPNVSNSDISWIGSIQAFLLCGATVFAGPVFDAGHPRLLIVFGSFMVVFGMMMTSLCSSYWQLMLAQGLCVGIGNGCLFLPAIAIVPSYFTTKKAIAMGVAASGSSFGGVIYPIIFYRLHGHVGFGWATRIIGFIALATLAIPCVLIKARAFPSARRKLIDLAAFKELPYSLFCLASFIGFIGLYVPFFYVSDYSEEIAGLDPTISFYMLPITSAGSIAGRILPGIIAYHTGPLNILGVCTLIAGLLGFCWMAIGHTLGGMVIWSLLYGAFSGSFVSLQPTTVVSLTSDLGTVGGRMGLNTFCAALGILIGTPIAGVLVGNGNWSAMQAFCGGTLIAGGALVIATRVSVAGVGLMKKA
ncbi:major facilitator superfamily domain-containing protein [Delphinella strobiligena]|nr:major facilitator superfamily domain-containing protein [Delphinella strobiligena]